MALQADNTLDADIFDYLIIPSDLLGDKVCFGIQSHVSKSNVRTETSESTHRRFSRIFFRTRRPIEDFRDLCEFMVSRYPNILLPVLPFQEAFADEDRDELERKRAQLQDFFQELLQIPDVFNDPCMPLFIQSHMPMGKIRDTLAQQEADGNNQQAGANANRAEANNRAARLVEADAQQAEAGNVNDQVVIDNEQQVPANNNNQQVLENRDGDQPFDGENAARGSASESETDEPIFHMEDI